MILVKISICLNYLIAQRTSDDIALIIFFWIILIRINILASWGMLIKQWLLFLFDSLIYTQLNRHLSKVNVFFLRYIKEQEVVTLEAWS